MLKHRNLVLGLVLVLVVVRLLLSHRHFKSSDARPSVTETLTLKQCSTVHPKKLSGERPEMKCQPHVAITLLRLFSLAAVMLVLGLGLGTQVLVNNTANEGEDR